MTRLRALALLTPCLMVAGCGAPLVREPAPAVPAAVAIGVVQGPGLQSALLGRVVTVEGIVTADQGSGRGGVFVQSARGSDDGDAATSDGLFVARDAGAVPVLATGQRVAVTGTVAELAGKEGGSMTALRDARVVVLGTGALPPALALTIVPDPESGERLEGMRVAVAGLTLAGPWDEQRDEAIVSLGGRLFQPTELARPGDASQALAADNSRRTLRLRGGAVGAPTWRAQAADAARNGRAGTRLRAVAGVFEPGPATPLLWLGTTAAIVPAARPTAPPSVLGGGGAGRVSIAAINLENYFNGDGRGGGYPTPRGARDAAAQARQLAKLVHVILELRPAVAALMEVENDGSGPDSALAHLVDALNAAGSTRRWRQVDTGAGPGSDAIRVAMIYDADTVAPHGAPATLEDGPFSSHSRSPLAQAFRPRGGGATLVVAANHFKSKGCRDAAGADADRGDGQSCWNATRIDSARRLDAWLKTDPTATGSDLSVIVGDLNSYRMEDPVVALTDAGWRDAFDVAGERSGAAADRGCGETLRPYSYVWNGQAGRLDHALLSPALAARLTGAAHWHINADETDAPGYANAAANQVPNPWRSSDHDPLLLGFDLGP